MKRKFLLIALILVAIVSCKKDNTTTTPAVTHVVGDKFGGGIVIYILKSGDLGYDPNVQHGLIVAPSDQTGTNLMRWYNGSYTTTGATGSAIGTGKTNTNTIIAKQGAGSYAAMLCHNLTLGGFNDWYLPSLYELRVIYWNVSIVSGIATGGYYWTSTEDDTAYTNAYQMILSQGGGGHTMSDDKAMQCSVRAVRSF